MSFLKDVIESLDPAPDKKKELTLAVQCLFELAEQRNKLFKKELESDLRTAGTPDNHTIPITQILAWHNETRAYVKDDAGRLADILIGAIRKFVAGGTDEVLSGIGELVTGALEAILGAGTATQTEMHAYYVVVEGFSIVRLDISAWSRHIEVNGWTTKIENALAFQAVKSSVDVDAITFNTFLQAYKAQLDEMKMPHDKLKELIVQAKEIFDLLRDSNASNTSYTGELTPPGKARLFIDGAPVGA